jgi:hypothetical protein
MTLTRDLLLDFVAVAIEIAENLDMPLAEALTTAAYIYPELASIDPDTQACELVWERYGR